MKVRGQAGCPPSHPLLPLAHNHPSLSSPRWSLHKLERKHGGARNHWPARPSLRLATAWSGSSGYRLWRTEEEEVRSCGAWGAARPRWVLRQAAGAGAPPTHRQKPPGRPTQPTLCLCQAPDLTRDGSNLSKNISPTHWSAWGAPYVHAHSGRQAVRRLI